MGLGDGSSSWCWSHLMLVALQGWEGDGEINGDVYAERLRQTENDQEKRSRLCN